MDAFKITPTEIQEMKNVNLLTADKTQLVDINTVKINHDLPKEERILRVLKKTTFFIESGLLGGLP